MSTKNRFFKICRQKEHLKSTEQQKNKASFSLDLSLSFMYSFVGPIGIETTMYQEQCEVVKILF